WIRIYASSTTRTRCATCLTMPRVTGESLCSTIWWILLKPSAFTVARWRSVPPIGLRTSCSLSRRTSAMGRLLGRSNGRKQRRRLLGRGHFRKRARRRLFDRWLGCWRARRHGRRGGDSAALLDHDLWVAQVGQRQQGGLHDVDGVRAAQRFAKDVFD